MTAALGLGGYGSSDEEEEPMSPVGKDEGNLPPETTADSTATADEIPQQEPLGPAPMPSAMPAPGLVGPSSRENGSAPTSPYTANRLLVRNLTMPPIPDFNIPPSPPGTPPAATSAKFAHFLQLKAQGVHFNKKLEQSSALRDPSLLPRLMQYAGINGEEQYASTLPEDVAVPTRFPDWCYADELVKSSEAMTKKFEQERAGTPRDAIDFVRTMHSAGSSRAGTPGGKGVAERVKAGLDKGAASSRSSSQGREGDSKGGRVERGKRSRFDEVGSRPRRRSRSP
ncbi:hypothetical protein LTR66_016018 [Elasticomyces elasticus]|nr:hypothetical protein LTR66_016018 [Elasticomyces elasticus]